VALIRCPECKATVSSKAASCPKCGAPVAAARASKKKRSGCGCVLALLVGGAIALGIAVNKLPSQETPSQTATSPAKPQYQFERASQAQVKRLKAVQEEDKRIAGTVYAVKSQHHKNVWYVSTKIYGPGLEDGISAVWSMSGDRANPGLVLAADTTADEFTPVPYMNDTKAGTGRGMDPEARALEKHVQTNVK